jgi:hypothetical protein
VTVAEASAVSAAKPPNAYHHSPGIGNGYGFGYGYGLSTMMSGRVFMSVVLQHVFKGFQRHDDNGNPGNYGHGHNLLAG